MLAGVPLALAFARMRPSPLGWAALILVSAPFLVVGVRRTLHRPWAPPPDPLA